MKAEEYFEAEGIRTDRHIKQDGLFYFTREAMFDFAEDYKKACDGKNGVSPLVVKSVCDDAYHKHCKLSTMQYKFCPECGIKL